METWSGSKPFSHILSVEFQPLGTALGASFPAKIEIRKVARFGEWQAHDDIIPNRLLQCSSPPGSEFTGSVDRLPAPYCNAPALLWPVTHLDNLSRYLGKLGTQLNLGTSLSFY